MAHRRNLERQRERVRELLRADPKRSSRSIAAEVGCSPHTVIRQREMHVQTHEPERTPATAHPGSENLLPPAGPGNTRSLKHGAYSQRRREPLEGLHRERLRVEFVSVPDDLINAAAKRLAMIDLLSAWLEDAGIVHPRKGLPSVSDAARELRILLRDHEAAITALREMERPDPVAAAYAHLQRRALEAGEG